MRVFLIYASINAYSSAYSYGLGYVAAVLKKNHHTVDYIILKKETDIPDLYRRIREDRPGLIAFSATTCQFHHLKDLVSSIKRDSNTFVICGGVHTTLRPECIEDIPDLDGIVRGEGEFPMQELAASLENGKNNLHSIRNMWFKAPGGGIIKNEMRPLLRSLDELPFPDKTSFDYQKILDDEGGVNRFIFSRGCVFSCHYCSNKALSDISRDGHYYRCSSPKRAIEEIALDTERFRFKKIYFDDDIICLDKKWFYEFFRLYKERFTYPFYCNVRVGTINEDMIKLLKEAGVRGVAIGIEQGNEEYRKKALNRPMTNAQIIETVRLCKEQGIKDMRGQVMIGLPYENEDLFLDTVRLCRLLNLKKYYIYIFHPYPGTAFEKLAREKGWLPKKENFLHQREAVIDYPDFSKEKIQLCFDVFRFLVRSKRLPLRIPPIRTISLLSFYKLLSKIRPKT